MVDWSEALWLHMTTYEAHHCIWSCFLAAHPKTHTISMFALAPSSESQKAYRRTRVNTLPTYHHITHTLLHRDTQIFIQTKSPIISWTTNWCKVLVGNPMCVLMFVCSERDLNKQPIRDSNRVTRFFFRNHFEFSRSVIIWRQSLPNPHIDLISTVV